MALELERQDIEHKSQWRDDWLEWICGFANAEGGELYVGVDDDGNPVKLNEKPKKLLEDIPNKIVQVLGIACAVDELGDPDHPTSASP